MALTKQDLKGIEDVLDKKLAHYQGAIVEAIDFKFQKIKNHMDGFDRKLDKLTTTLDRFVKMMTDQKEEFTILKAESD